MDSKMERDSLKARLKESKMGLKIHLNSQKYLVIMTDLSFQIKMGIDLEIRKVIS
jgi:hypothetical protein